MQRAILVLSKNASLIELIRSNLEEGGRYYVQGVTSVHGTLAMVRHRSFDLAILDLEKSEPSASQLIHNLKAIQPEIKILIYDHNDPSLIENLPSISVDGFLARPFFAPELSDQLKNLFSAAGSNPSNEISLEPESASPDLPPQTLNLDIEEITPLLERTRATAAMTFVRGSPVAKTSSMSPVIAQKISEMITTIWPGYRGCDFCRFLKADDEIEACLVYALPMTPDVVLAFTYPSGSDLRSIRQETLNLRDAYMISRYAAQNGSAAAASQRQMEDREFQNVTGSFAEDLDSAALPNLGERDSQWVLELDEIAEEPLPPALEDIIRSELPGEQEVSSDQSLSETQPIRVRTETATEKTTIEASNTPVEEKMAKTSTPAEEGAHQVQETAPSFASPDTSPGLSITLPWETTASVPEVATAEEANVLSAAMAAQEAIARDLPAARKSCSIYHCVILPNGPRQFLTRELGEQSAALIRRHHQMNGWDLLRLTIRPQYAMWTVNLPVSIDPVKVVEEIKDETSDFLLASHPDEQLAAEGRSFWAAGYWILSGQHPPSGSLIKQFLNFGNQKSAKAQNPAD